MVLYSLLLGVVLGNDIVSLEKGQEAPFTGTLLSPSASAKIITDADFALEEYRIRSEREISLLNLKAEYDNRYSASSLLSCETKSSQILEIKDQHIEYLEKQNNGSIYPAVWFASGILAGTLTLYGSSLMLKNIGQ